MKRILILGVSSFIGSNLARRLREKYRIFGTYQTRPLPIDDVIYIPLSITPKAPLEEWLLRLTPDVVIYCAGEGDPRKCEADPLGTLFVHAEAPQLVASTLARTGGRLIYLSSSKVFSGEKGDYTEEDDPRPATAYGQAKRQAESHLAEYENVFCLRLGTVFGLSSYERSSFTTRLLQALWEEKPIPLINDELRTFFFVDEVARAIERVIEAPLSDASLYHLSHGGKSSYFGFGKKLAESFGLSEAPLRAVGGDHFGMDVLTSAARGRDMSLDGTLFERTFGIRFRSLDETIADFREQLHLGRH